MRHDMGAVARSDLGLVGLDDRVERGRIDEALGDEHGFKRADAQLDLGKVGAVIVMVMVAAHVVARLAGKVLRGPSVIVMHGEAG
ncbi:MAG: hypothetical protein NVSMB26_15040 [Beijerinckiaceae bacterium]